MYVPICLLLDSALHLLSFYLLPWISWICKAQNGLLSQIQVLYYAGWLRLAILITGFPNTNGAVSNLTYVKKSFIINSRGHPTWKAGQLGKWDWKPTVILSYWFLFLTISAGSGGEHTCLSASDFQASPSFKGKCPAFHLPSHQFPFLCLFFLQPSIRAWLTFVNSS